MARSSWLSENKLNAIFVHFLPHIAELGQLLSYLFFTCSFQFLYFCFIGLFFSFMSVSFYFVCFKEKRRERESIILVR